MAMLLPIAAGVAPVAAHAEDAAVTEDSKSERFQTGPCGLRALRGQGGGTDLIGVWHCASHVLLPARFSDTDADDESSIIIKKNAPKWRVRVNQDRVMVTVGIKW